MPQPASINDRPILYFDGECNLCNRAVQFVIRHDKRKCFLFASLQSAAGEEALKHINGPRPDSLVLQYRGLYYIKSDAALHTARLLGGFTSLLFIFAFVPRFVRDGVYNIIARHRYKWFGRRDECMIPTPELRERFIS